MRGGGRTIRKATDEELNADIARAREEDELAAAREPQMDSARYLPESGLVELSFRDGCRFSFPPHLVPGLGDASPANLAQPEVIGDGYALRWETLDVDVVVPDLLAERLGSRRGMAASLGRAGGRVRSDAKSRVARRNGRKGGRPHRPESGG